MTVLRCCRRLLVRDSGIPRKLRRHNRAHHPAKHSCGFVGEKPIRRHNFSDVQYHFHSQCMCYSERNHLPWIFRTDVDTWWLATFDWFVFKIIIFFGANNFSLKWNIPQLVEVFRGRYNRLHLDIGRHNHVNAFCCRTLIRLGTVFRRLHPSHIRHTRRIDLGPCIFRQVRYTFQEKNGQWSVVWHTHQPILLNMEVFLRY